MSTDAERDPWGPAPVAQAPAPPEWVSIGPGSTDVIPRLWAERILGDLRSNHEPMWRKLLGRASTGG